MGGYSVHEWRSKAKAMLAEGYGVEDIALILGVPVSDVRALVVVMRDSGLFKEMFR